MTLRYQVHTFTLILLKLTHSKDFLKMGAGSHIAFITLLLIIVAATLTFADFVQPPVDTIALVGDTVTFTCEAKGDMIDFMINGTQADSLTAFQLGFTESTIEVKSDNSGQSTLLRHLSVWTSSTNNNSMITCRVIIQSKSGSNKFNVHQISKPAHLLVKRVSVHKPAFANVTLARIGDQHSFECMATARRVSFLANGTSVTYLSVYKKGFDQSPVTYYSETVVAKRTLTFNSSVENNNTYISCIAISSISSESTADVDTRLLTLHLVVDQDSIDLISPDVTKSLINTNMIPTPTVIDTTQTEDKIIKYPESVTVIHGDIGVFECQASESVNEINYYVNESFADVGDIPKQGFTMDYTDNEKRRLYADSNYPKSNKSKIVCAAFFPTNKSELHQIKSPPVEFLVQGPLAAVHHLYVIWSDNSSASSSAYISWEPPFTLPKVNITGYNLTFFALPEGEEVPILHRDFTSETFYLWNISCTRVMVAAYNGLDGIESSRLIVPPPQVAVQNTMNIANKFVNISLSLNVSASIACWNHFMLVVQVKIIDTTDSNENYTTFDGTVQIFNSSSRSIMTSDNITLPSNKEYRGELKYAYSKGNHHFSSKLQKFKTDPPLSLVPRISAQSNDVEFECKFSPDNADSASGCSVKLLSKSNPSYNLSNTSTNTADINKHIVLISDVDNGEYILEGYIIESTSGPLPPMLAFIDDHYNVSHTVVPSSLTTTSSESSSYSSMTPPTSTTVAGNSTTGYTPTPSSGPSVTPSRPTPTSEPSVSPNSTSASPINYKIILAIVIPLTALVLVLIIALIIVSSCLYKSKKTGNVTISVT